MAEANRFNIGIDVIRRLSKISAARWLVAALCNWAGIIGVSSRARHSNGMGGITMVLLQKFSTIQDVGGAAMTPPLQIVPEKLFATEPIKGKFGYINCSGYIVVAPQFDIAQEFHEDLAQVRVGDQWGFIDKTGNMVITPRFRSVGEFSEGLAFAAETGSPNWGVIDKTGKFVIEPKFANGHRFSEGLARVDMHWGMGERHYINRKGEAALVLSDGYAPGGDFYEGLALVYKDGKLGFINKKGEVIIPLQYDKAGNFSEGLAPVQINDKYIYIDKTGKQIISQSYDFTFGFSEGLAAIEIDGKWGYIDKAGQIAIRPQFKSVNYFRGGLAPAKNFDGKEGYINRLGQYVCGPNPD